MAQTNLRERAVIEKLNSMAVDSIHVIPDIVEDTYANGDLMAEGEIIPNAVVQDGGCGILQSVVGIDTTDSITTGVTLVITGDNADFGSVGSAPTAEPAAGDSCFVVVDLNQWDDIGTVRVSQKHNIGAVLKANSNTKSLYFAVINNSGGAITIGSGKDIEFKFGIVKD
tara:strand:- start:385 stop:891 length:507 start_codon:yes stop_codon:yes gene_type:complete